MPTLKLSRTEKILFLDNFGSLITAGIPIVRALQIIYFQSKNPRIRSLSAYIKGAIEQGRRIPQVCMDAPKVFSPFDRAMFEMGEATGKIGQILEIITEREEKQLELDRKIRQALVYPASIVLVSIIMIVIIMTYVVPKIEKIYHDSHVNLPRLTQTVIDISHFVRDDGVAVLFALVACFGLATIALRHPSVRYTVDRLIFRIPIFGDMMRKKTLIVFTEFLSTLLGAGILINRALLIIRSGMNNAYYEREIDGIIEDIRVGKALSSGLGAEYIERKIRGEKDATGDRLYANRIDCFPVELSMAVSIGEQTGTLSKMLQKTALRYNKEVDASVRNLSSMLEPIIIVVIGGIVGVIIMAIMLPFFNMVNVVG